MNNQSKRGFSLVEVMILFTVLAVAMAAALPIITKKSKPVPTKARHGVYRCIALSNGRYLEETYNSFRRIKSNDRATSCNFRVPNASIYKIDLFSAGAGGTKYMAYKPVLNDNRSAQFNMSDAANYARTGTLSFSNQTATSSRKDMPYQLTDENIRLALKDEHIITTGYSADAGKGGDATYQYQSPADAICDAVLYGRGKYEEKKDNAYNALTTAQENYNNYKYLNYDKRIEDWQKKIEEYNEEITENNAKIDKYNSVIPLLETFASAMTGLQSSFDDLKSATTFEKRKQAYDAFKGAINKGASGYNFSDIYANSPTNEVASGYNNVYAKMTTYVWDTGSNTVSSCQKKMNTVNNWLNNESKHKRDVLDEDGNKVYDEDGKVVQRNGTEAEKLEDLVNNTTYMKYLSSSATTGNYSATHYADAAATEATKYVSRLKDTYIKNLEDRNAELELNAERATHVIELINKELEDSLAENGELNKLLKKIDDAQEEYDDRANKYNDVLNADIQQMPLYKDKQDHRFDIPSSDYVDSETTKQINDYCKNQESFKEYYQQSEYGWDNSLHAYKIQGDVRSVAQTGGDKGMGRWMKLDYVLFYGADEEGAYSTSTYPFVKHIGTLFGNVDGHGYALSSCSNLSFTSCNTSTISNAEDGESISSLHGPGHERPEMSSFSLDGVASKILRAKDGKNVGRFMAYKLPNGTYASLQAKAATVNGVDVAATGGKHGAVGYMINNNTYTTGDETTNLAWKTFVGEGTTSNVSKAEAGRGAVLSATPLEVANRYKITSATQAEAQQPRISQSARLWTKEYSVGQAGDYGKHLHFQVSSMGERCTISIPHGGPIFDYMYLVKYAEDHELNVDEHLMSTKEDYESRLSAFIGCYDKDGLAVFEKTLNGGTYNIEPSGWILPFFWNRNVSSHYVAGGGGGNPYYQVRSKWAKIFHTMAPLYNYDVGTAGNGTSMTDYCVAPKGDYDFKTYRLTSAGGAGWTETLLSGLNKTYSNSYDGKKNDIDCYRDDEGEGSYDGIRVLYNTYPYSSMTEEERNLYRIYNPDSAGGGAVVITW